MKKIITICAEILMTISVFAQAPEKMSYQALVRDGSNNLVSSTAVGMQISILQSSSSGIAVYVETQTPTSNANGLVSLEIGAGTVVSGTFATIDWANGPYFIKTETDPTGGTIYTITGTSQLLSVPYALHAKTASNVPTTLGAFTNDVGYLTSEVDGSTTNEIQTISRTGTAVSLSNGGGSFQDSVGIYTAGTGINITNNVVTATVPTYTIGLWPELGGYVFWVSPDGKHGIVAEIIDQGYFQQYYIAQDLISNPANHSTNGQNFRDWRLPTLFELQEIYALRNNIGGFQTEYYWSTKEVDYTGDAYEYVWKKTFFNGSETNGGNKSSYACIRSVRTF